ncbi:hypothetical protein AB0B79_25640 [Streptomyces sp. NPDC039022]|uniref:hypothetical protein n=1 Tax=Streptomyces sp. NPDC039022 TaxID=3157091 RepID=UPI0033FFE35A
MPLAHVRASTDRTKALRDESHRTRREVTRPLVTLRLLIEAPALRAAADQMITLTCAIRDSIARPEDVTAARKASLTAELTAAHRAAADAHDHFVDTAARYLTHNA